MKYSTVSKPFERMDKIKINGSTKIIVERGDNLRKILEEIVKVGLEALRKEKFLEQANSTERGYARRELGILLPDNELLKKCITIFSTFDWIYLFIFGKRRTFNSEGLWLPKLGLELWVTDYPKDNKCVLQVANNIFEPVFGNPDIFMAEVQKRIG
jgi:hypothetical protein